MERPVSLCYKKQLYYSWHAPKHEQKYHKTNGNCCIWHVLGPEQRDGKEDMPMLPYQKVLYQALQENKRIWIKKARGIGITTFFLYYISWLCLTQLQPGDRVCCVVGPRLEAAQDWLDRFKALISRKNR